MFILNPYRFTPSVAFIGLLDTYTGSVGAYSVRLLTTTFSGSAPLRLLRVGSSVEVDVHFDYTPIVPVVTLNSAITPVVPGSTTATTLGEFIAAAGYTDADGLGTGASASVRLLRDQISIRDLGQSVPTQQPLFAQSGALTLVNGHVSILFDGSNDFLSYQGSFYDPTDISTFTVYKLNGTTTGTYICFLESATTTAQRRQSASQASQQVGVQRVYTGFSTISTSNGTIGQNEVVTVNRWAYDAPNNRTYVYANPTLITQTANSGTVYQANNIMPSIANLTELLLGAIRTNNATGFTSVFSGYISECIIFNDTDSTGIIATPAVKRTPITANILSYY